MANGKSHWRGCKRNSRGMGRIGRMGAQMKASRHLWAGLLAMCAVMGGGWLYAAPETAPSPAKEKARILLVTGVDYPGHHWRETAPVLAEALGKDPRLEVFRVDDPAFLDSQAINKYDVILLHFQNWQQAGAGEKAGGERPQVPGGGDGAGG